MKRGAARLGPPEGPDVEANLIANGGVGEAQNEAPYYNIGLPKKAALLVEGGGPPPRLLNIRQLSDYLAMPVATIYTWVCLRRVPAACIVRLGRSLRFDRAAVDLWIEEQRIRS
jgi:excisionase family DNA binding protein